MELLLPVNWTGNGLVVARKLDRKWCCCCPKTGQEMVLLLPVNWTGNVARKLDRKCCS